jgi:hypothetical protein
MTRPRLAALLGLAVALGVVEGCIAIVLRLHLDPSGTLYPEVNFPASLSRLEQLREAAALVVLAASAWLAGDGPLARWGGFVAAFGCWDLVYYLELRLGIGWPAKLTDWDLLFLIPRPWYGPVYAPLVVAVTMLGCGLALLHRLHHGGRFPVRGRDVCGVTLGGLLVVASFLWPEHAPSAPWHYWAGALVAGETVALWAFAAAWRRGR